MIEQKACSRFTKTVLGVLTAVLCSTALQARADEPSERVTSAGQVFKELIDSPNGIPTDLLNKASCVIVLPSVKKGGFIVGGQYGKGVMTCRSGANFNGKWSAPIMMQSSGGSFGLQAGGEAVDYVVLVMNDEGARTVMHGKAKLGANAKGVFGGLSLAGTSLGPDAGDNEKLYGKKVTGQEIFAGSVPAPPSASALLSELQRKSPKNLSKGK
jgi:lipid-binding SYLF domain-containing protein